MSTKVINILKQRSVQTALVLSIYIAVGRFLPVSVHEGFYTISLFIKDILMWLMPLTVGFFIAHTVISFEKKAPLFIGVLIVFETFSNLSSVWYAYGSAHIAAEFMPGLVAAPIETMFEALWRIPFERPQWWSAEKGALIGLLLGCIFAFMKDNIWKTYLAKGKSLVEWVLTKVFSRLIPLFVLGFAAQMLQTNLISHILGHYAVLVLWMLGFLSTYLIFLTALGAGLSLKNLLGNIKNLLPAGGISLTSGCSLSTMPWTIEGASKNLDNPQLAKAIIPATTNIQQVGDCIANTFLCFLIYRHFYGHNPDFSTWLVFSSVFVLARFATAAILGGAIFIMLPIYETYLNFNSEMIAIILGLNVVLDPLITSCNVLGNGALCRVFEKVWMRAQELTRRFVFYRYKYF